MRDENPICNLGDYSKSSHEGYMNTIELPVGNNVVPLRSDTIRLVQNGCSFHGLRSEDPNQHLNDFLKLVDSLELDDANRERTRLLYCNFSLRSRRTINQSAGGKLRDRNAKESWALLEDLALYDNESWNEARDFTKSVKAIALPQDVPNTSNGLVPTTLSIAWKIPNKPLLNTHPRVPIKRETRNAQPMCMVRSTPSQAIPSNKATPMKDNPKNIHVNPSTPPDLSISFITEKVIKLNSFFESFGLVPQSSNTELVYTKGDDGDVMFIEIVQKNKNSLKEEPEAGEHEVEYFDMLPNRSELAYHKENSNRGVSNFTGRIKGMHIFIGNFTYVIDFMIVNDISSTIDPRMSQVLLGRPFVEISNVTHDLPKEKEHTKSVYLRNKEDKRRGVEYVMSIILGFYKECLELEPEYAAGIDDEGKVTKSHMLEEKQISSVRVFDEVFSTWMAFGGKNTLDLGSFGEETDKITDLHQIHEEVLFTKRGDGVTCIKRRRRDLSSDGVRDLATASGRVRLKEDLESST
nr:MAK10-like protein [Tanacetum cinerariifolium]